MAQTVKYGTDSYLYIRMDLTKSFTDYLDKLGLTDSEDVYIPLRLSTYILQSFLSYNTGHRLLDPALISRRFKESESQINSFINKHKDAFDIISDNKVYIDVTPVTIVDTYKNITIIVSVDKDIQTTSREISAQRLSIH